MTESFIARNLLNELQTIVSAAWGTAPTPDQARELWRCIWEVDDSIACEVLGDAMVVRPMRLKIRALAESSDRWWLWTLAGKPFAVRLAGAQAMFREDEPAMSDEAAADYLRGLRESLDRVGKMAIDRALKALVCDAGGRNSAVK